ncbi:hypothetical protein [Ferrimonas balearica]|uniref:hypothetical protein n=1 Tax=Ferrimonas balearica TaxID=44012 RepID=UPI001C97D509|nr:hypothetical protein [Ferrimonas balearica]MBY6223774.1 hypothetical protein [Ferrimonas balearica]
MLQIRIAETHIPYAEAALELPLFHYEDAAKLCLGENLPPPLDSEAQAMFDGASRAAVIGTDLFLPINPYVCGYVFAYLADIVADSHALALSALIADHLYDAQPPSSGKKRLTSYRGTSPRSETRWP